MTDPAGDPTSEPAQASELTTEQASLNVTALFAEAASKSGLMWVDVPGDRAWPFWHAWAQDTVFAVSGPGEQTLPWMPEEVRLIARSKDTGGRLLTVRATVRDVRPEDPLWEAATTALKAERLNSTDDVVDRWARECTVRAFQPHGVPVEAPGAYATGSGAAPVPASPATTTGWRPWHWRGRPRSRRGTRARTSPDHEA